MRILWIHEFLPSPATSGSSLRMMQLLMALRRQGHEITYLSLFTDHHESGAELQRETGIKYYVGDAEMLTHFGVEQEKQWDLRQMLQAESYDVAVVTLWFWTYLTVPELYINQIRKHSPQTSIVLLSDDQHALRKKMEARLTGSRLLEEVTIDIERREREAIARCDAAITIAEAERQWILSICPDKLVGVIPFHVEVPAVVPEYECRAGILILGDFSNEAMRDGYTWFLSDIWPSIQKKLPDVTCSLAGNRSQTVHSWANTRIRCLGQVGDLDAVFGAHRMFLTPVRFGTGIITKNLVALAQGIPVITTSIGARSLSLRHMQDAVVGDDPKDMADQAMQVYTDPEMWQRLSEAGPAYVRKSFTRECTYHALERFMSDLCTVGLPRNVSGVKLASPLIEDVSRSVNVYPVRYRAAARAKSILNLAEQLLHSQKQSEAAIQFRSYLSQMENAKSAVQHGRCAIEFGSGNDIERGIGRALRGLDQCCTSDGPIDSANCSQNRVQLQRMS